ncbi:MAG: hypothetical protein ACLP01_08400 [Solirubrobacteraceae bacterium]
MTAPAHTVNLAKEDEGAQYESAAPNHVHVVTDGRLVTGQKPVSAQATALAFLEELELAEVLA